jgi:hypothetical protein
MSKNGSKQRPSGQHLLHRNPEAEAANQCDQMSLGEKSAPTVAQPISCQN